jgi:hypothetical protein
LCAYKEHYPSASQQNSANYFRLLWGKPFSWCCVGHILSIQEIKEWFQFTIAPILMPIGVVLQWGLTVRLCKPDVFMFCGFMLDVL